VHSFQCSYDPLKIGDLRADVQGRGNAVREISITLRSWRKKRRNSVKPRHGSRSLVETLFCSRCHYFVASSYPIIIHLSFINDGTTDIIVDDATPSNYPDVDNHPEKIFAAKGFYTSDAVDRQYEDMGTEPGGNGLSKARFFVMNACEINNWTHYTYNLVSTNIEKNIGNLYALGHNGLICMGASTTDMPNKDAYIDSLAMGYDFGQAYLAQQNQYF
jgi:hypothetical protein